MSRGGAQPGAGRKPAPPGYKKLTKGIRLPGWIWEWLDTLEDPRGVVVEEALKRVHKLKPHTAG